MTFCDSWELCIVIVESSSLCIRSTGQKSVVWLIFIVIIVLCPHDNGIMLKVKVSYLTSVAKQAKTAFLHGPTVWKSPIVGIEPMNFSGSSSSWLCSWTSHIVNVDHLCCVYPLSLPQTHRDSGETRKDSLHAALATTRCKELLRTYACVHSYSADHTLQSALQQCQKPTKCLLVVTHHFARRLVWRHDSGIHKAC